MLEQTRGRLPADTSNNVAEYRGLRACMLRALDNADVDDHVLFKVDSKIVALQ